MSSATELAVCVIGIYVCFLSWGVLQERVSTTPYNSIIAGEAPARFNYFIFLNFAQAAFACTVALIYAKIIRPTSFAYPDAGLVSRYTFVAFLNSIASPFGYESLKHVDYPTMILAKSCKLIPVMVVSFAVYRKTFKWYQYLSVVLISIGVSLFTLLHPVKKGESKSNSLYGLFLLFINLLIDGLTNSTQDFINRRYGGTGTQMMFYMNFFSSLLMVAYMLIVTPLLFGHSELFEAFAFIQSYPDAIQDIVLFGLAGALGQVFIFYVISTFDSRVLVTVNVTRKMMTMILSVFWFGHRLSLGQWASVGLVFAAVLLETYASKKSSSKPPPLKEENVVVEEEKKKETKAKKRD